MQITVCKFERKSESLPKKNGLHLCTNDVISLRRSKQFPSKSIYTDILNEKGIFFLTWQQQCFQPQNWSQSKSIYRNCEIENTCNFQIVESDCGIEWVYRPSESVSRTYFGWKRRKYPVHKDWKIIKDMNYMWHMKIMNKIHLWYL